MTAKVTRCAAGEVELVFTHAQASVGVRVALADTPGESEWSMSVAPADPAWTVGQVAFPVLETPSAANGNEQAYLLPRFEDRLLPLRQRPFACGYPADLFAQMIACLAPSGGFLLWTDDGDGHVKRFDMEKRGDTATFAVRHLPSYDAGRKWQMPYRTRLSFCGGTWLAAAKIYRDWSAAQPWSASPWRERGDVPDILKRPPLCISTQLDRENLETLPDRLAAWG